MVGIPERLMVLERLAGLVLPKRWPCTGSHCLADVAGCCQFEQPLSRELKQTHCIVTVAVVVVGLTNFAVGYLAAFVG